MATKTLQIGALCDPISKQLAGLISEKDATVLDADHDAINQCYVRGYMPDRATERARLKLLKRCQEAINARRSNTQGDPARKAERL